MLLGVGPGLAVEHLSQIRSPKSGEHNLKNLTLDIPRDKLVVLAGLSGSGKSSLASACQTSFFPSSHEAKSQQRLSQAQPIT